jgi:hypothetical protein
MGCLDSLSGSLTKMNFILKRKKIEHIETHPIFCWDDIENEKKKNE